MPRNVKTRITTRWPPEERVFFKKPRNSSSATLCLEFSLLFWLLVEQFTQRYRKSEKAANHSPPPFYAE